jgi:hypothetical protein
MKFINTSFTRVSVVILCLLAIGGLQVAAMNLMKLPINTALANNNKGNYTIKLVKINLNEYFGSGTLVPAGYLSQTGELAKSGLLTTTHIFQSPEIKNYLQQGNKVINLSAENTMQCKYSFGEAIEYATFVPIETLSEMINNDLIGVETIHEIKTNSAFETSKINTDTATQIFGSASNEVDLGQKGVQKGDSGAIIFQRRADGLNSIGIQFGYAKNSTSPMTIIWRLKKEGDNVKANVAWLRNKDNKLVWDNGEYLPKNCDKIQQ